MRLMGIATVLVVAVAGSAAAQTRVDNAVLVTVPGATSVSRNSELVNRGIDAAANALMDVSLSLETDTASRAIFVQKVFIARSRCILPPHLAPAFQAGVAKAVSWCQQAKAANHHLEKPVGSYTELKPSRKWEGLALGISNVKDVGCSVRVSGYSSGPGGGTCSIYVSPSAAQKLAAALSRVAEQGALLRDEAVRAAETYRSLR